MTTASSARQAAATGQAALTVSGLIPMLQKPDWREKIRLSDDGFCDAIAGLSLSESVALSIGHFAGSSYKNLSYRALDEMGLSVREAWDAAAENLINASLSDEGIEFFTRSARYMLGRDGDTGLQIRVDGHPISSWVAHPKTFNILNAHLKRLLSTDAVIYIVTGDRMMLAFPESELLRADFLAELCYALTPLGQRKLSEMPLLWSNGFPYSFTTPPHRRAA